MRFKLLVTIVSFVILVSIIYFEQNNAPYNNLKVITNNSETNIKTDIIDIGADLEKKYQSININNTKNNQQTTKSKNKTKKTSNNIELPNFPITIIGNKKIKNIYDIKANKIIIHFWASWCNVCKSEFKDIIEHTQDNHSTAVVAISVDDNRDDLGKYLDIINHGNHLKKINNLYFSWDQDKSISLDLFGTQMLPENYIITMRNNKYEVIEKTIGRSNWAEILKA